MLLAEEVRLKPLEMPLVAQLLLLTTILAKLSFLPLAEVAVLKVEQAQEAAAEAVVLVPLEEARQIQQGQMVATQIYRVQPQETPLLAVVVKAAKRTPLDIMQNMVEVGGLVVMEPTAGGHLYSAQAVAVMEEPTAKLAGLAEPGGPTQ